jgi:hypothetical protein
VFKRIIIDIPLDEEQFRRLVAFCILMENGGGILEKAPGYIEEKLWLCLRYSEPESNLDGDNKKKARQWLENWEKYI